MTVALALCPPSAPLQWESIPDIGDYTIKKQKHLDRFTPVPDSLLASAAAREATATAIDASGLATPMGGATTDLTAIGAGRNTVVQVGRLDPQQHHARVPFPCVRHLWCRAGGPLIAQASAPLHVMTALCQAAGGQGPAPM